MEARHSPDRWAGRICTRHPLSWGLKPGSRRTENIRLQKIHVGVMETDIYGLRKCVSLLFIVKHDTLSVFIRLVWIGPEKFYRMKHTKI